MITDYTWIDDNSDLEALNLLVKNSQAVAFDSEFERINTFFPTPALFQLYLDERYFLIDMKCITAVHVFKSLLDRVILHSGSEDLEILLNLNNALPGYVFDTQIAASLCGFGLHFSYQNIVKELIGVELPKGHSRSDWMKRPLSKNQISYAIDDVVYLNQLKDILTEKLENRNRMQWFDKLSKQKLDAIVSPNYIDKTYCKMVLSKHLDTQQSKLVYALLKWRDELAIKRNKPRQWTLKNDQIIELAKCKNISRNRLIQDVKLSTKFVDKNLDVLQNLINVSKNFDEDSLPFCQKLSAKQGQVFSKEKEKLLQKCKELNVPSAIVINITELKLLVAKGKTLEDIAMWNLIAQ